jgi:hypothetical protein
MLWAKNKKNISATAPPIAIKLTAHKIFSYKLEQTGIHPTLTLEYETLQTSTRPTATFIQYPKPPYPSNQKFILSEDCPELAGALSETEWVEGAAERPKGMHDIANTTYRHFSTHHGCAFGSLNITPKMFSTKHYKY